MCINQAVSLNTFLLGLFSVSLAAGNHIIGFSSALHYMTFISIQLVEFFAWRHLNDKEKIKFISIIGFTLILLQPFFYIIAYMQPTHPYKNLLLGLYVLFVAIVVFVLIPYYNIQFSMSKASNGHLAWHWLSYPLWVVCIWFFFIVVVLLINKEYIRTLIWTIVVGYIYIQYVKTETWGSIWCWIANVLSLILLYLVFSKSIDYECRLLK